MPEDRRTVGAIVAATVAGYALGLLPLLMSTTEDIRLVFGFVALIFVGGLLLPGIAAGFIAASPGRQHRTAVVVLVVAVSTAIILGMLTGGLSLVDASPVILLLSLVVIGTSIGYWAGGRKA